ncbi:hypothetical protein ACFQS7_05665 [Dankookia sp. GCM10030260]|uniref:hypothetical protein n=1 Tax=Dankookia sp. GCM10030260 TaxID=3273390 RepID=UPI00361855D0
MKALVRLLLCVLLLGTAVQQGWLHAGTRLVVETLGGPAALEPQATLDGMLLLRRLTGAIGILPDPWYSLAMMVLGSIALVLAVSVIGGCRRIATRFSGWLRDASV